MTFGDRVLSSPDLFPARSAGEAWGERDLVIEYPSGPFFVSGLAEGHVESLEERFGHRVRSGPRREEAVVVRVFRAPASDFREPGPVHYTLDLDPQPSFVRLAGHRLMGRIELEPRLCGALWTPAERFDEGSRPLENVLRAMAAYRLLAEGGLLVHCAALADGTGVYLFLGASGAGKSTISRLGIEAGLTVVSDDLNAIRPGDGDLRIEGVPYSGQLTGADPPDPSVPVRALVRLQKGDRHEIRALGPAEAVALLVSSAPYVNADPHRFPALVERAEAIVASLRRLGLGFARDPGFWPLLAEELSR